MNLRTLLAALALGFALVPTADAQTGRIGYLDPDLIVPQLPEYAQVRQTLEARQREIAADLQVREDSLRQEFEAIQALGNSAVASAQARQDREQAFLRRQGALQQRQQAGLQELSRREVELIQPLLERVQQAIDAEAAAQGLALVVAVRANNAPILLYASDAAVNLQEPVLVRLGIPVTAEGAGGN